METQRRTGERGMASIVITMVTMVVITLIVLGFAALSRREQRQTLDQQLSTQAFYAAETGVEDARAVIKAAIKNGQPIVAKTQCTTNDSGNTYPVDSAMVIDGPNQVSYTCLKVDPSPTSLQYNSVSGSNLVLPITASQTITSLEITWTPSMAPTGTPAVCPNSATNSFSPQSKWNCGYGLLRADIVPTNGALTRAGLAGSTLSAFFVPTKSGSPGQLAYTGNTNKPNLLAADCDTASYGSCKATITNFSGQTAVSLRLNSMYQPSNIKIVAYHNATPMGITGVQAVVDSTGKAVDVLRRIQVRLPVIATGGLLPSSALQSNGSICKRFSTTGTYFAVASDIASPLDASNAMCDGSKIDGTP